jgi:hypothetical protein
MVRLDESPLTAFCDASALVDLVLSDQMVLAVTVLDQPGTITQKCELVLYGSFVFNCEY